jgi:transposase-like protein
VECDEAYVAAGHKGQPEVVKSKRRKGRRRRPTSQSGRGTVAKEKPPIFGMMQRGGLVVLHLLANVKQKTIEPFIKDTIESGTLIYTDEYSIYARLEQWGYSHKSVNHGRGEYARDEDGDGLCEVHVNTMEGFWSLLRSWLRPHRGIAVHITEGKSFRKLITTQKTPDNNRAFAYSLYGKTHKNRYFYQNLAKRNGYSPIQNLSARNGRLL